MFDKRTEAIHTLEDAIKATAARATAVVTGRAAFSADDIAKLAAATADFARAHAYLQDPKSAAAPN